MCGIAGMLAASQPVDLAALEQMVAAMAHRGPDDRGTWHHEGLGLGMSRLAIQDLSAAGHQPMLSADQELVIVYNGEVYNFPELRRELAAAGVTFRSHSDTEVVLELYRRYGDDFLLRLRGMFALAICDRRPGPGRERVLLARDFLGIKPLLYAQCGSRLVFASELKALLASGLVPARVRPGGVRELLAYGSVTQPGTLLAGVQALLPAHRMVWQSGRLRVERYWQLGADRHPELAHASYEEQKARIAAEVDQIVAGQLLSDVPVAAFLSGGIDSSLVVATMVKLAGRRVRTYSVGFGDESSAQDETDDAGRIAAHLGTDHQRLQVGDREACAEFAGFVRGLDQPSVDGFNSYLVCRAARQGATVALSGTGGDELFAGYPWFINMRQYEEEGGGGHLDPAYLGPAFDHDTSPKARAQRAGSFLGTFARQYCIYADEAPALLHPDLRPSAHPHRDAIADWRHLDELPEAGAVRRASALCLRGYACNQLLRDIDAVSMHHSLEVRVPLLDHRLADLALSLPDDAKLGATSRLPPAHLATYRQSGAKRILVDVGRPYLPGDFDEQPKRGFNLPLTDWLHHELRPIMAELLSPHCVAEVGLLDATAVSAIHEGFLRGERVWAHVWPLMVLQAWAREFL